MEQATMVRSSPAVFVKHYHPDQFAAELAKARLMAGAAAAVGIQVPPVLDADERAGTISYGYLDCPVSLLDVMSDRAVALTDILARVEGAGAALAALHRTLPTAGFPRRHRSRHFEQELGPEPPGHDGRLVLQHGDYGYSNIRFSPAGALVVIDPSPNLYVSVDPLNVDHPELDLALIASNFVGRTVRPVAMARTMGRGRELCAALLRGYEGQGAAVDRPRLRAYTRATVRSFAVWCQRGRPQVLVPLARLLERNLP